MKDKSTTGRLGEDIACDYLKSKGYSIIRRNYRAKIGEIDIVAKSPDRTLVFVEVKTLEKSGNPATRLSDGQAPELEPEDNMTRSKIHKFKRICELYLTHYPEKINERMGWRTDLVAISLVKENEPKIRHYENIF